MKIKILGSGGFTTTPKPLCDCEVCQEARSNPLFARTGPSVYIFGLDLLIDLPCETKQHIEHLGHFPKNITFSHWHPDHTEGWRVLELFDNQPTVLLPTDSKIEEKVPGLSFLDSKVIKIKPWAMCDKITQGSMEVSYIKINEDIPVYAFLISEKDKRALICMDHAKSLLNMDPIKNLDLLVMNMGAMDNNKDITTFEDNFEIIKRFEPKKATLLHIEEAFGLNRDKLNDMMKKYYPSLNIVTGYDGMIIN